MAKVCPNCGKEVIENSSFCENCGAPVAAGNQQAPTQTTGGGMVQNRNLVMCIVLTFVTCGIYGLYWLVQMAEDANTLTNDHKTSGVMVVVFSLITCGIYSYFWYYNMGKRLNAAGQQYGKNISDNSVLYLILGLLGLGIVNYGLIQNDLNQFSN